jgi:hypothetical protein
MTDEARIESLKQHIYGIGRGAGIQVIPRNATGSLANSIHSLAVDVLIAEVVPRNEALGPEVCKAYQELQLAARAPIIADCIEIALRNYVDARIRKLSAGAVE